MVELDPAQARRFAHASTVALSWTHHRASVAAHRRHTAPTRAMSEPITQAQDHDRRIGRLEGIAEQLTEQNRQTNARLDRIKQTIAEQGRQINGRIDSLTRWLVGMQVASLIALGTLILTPLA